MTTLVSIIIVNYKSEIELLACIASIKKTADNISYEIIVVDNNEENTLQTMLRNQFPDVIYLKTKSNNGFGSGNNYGAKHANGKYLFFLNPDTLLLPNTIKYLGEYLNNHSDFAIAAPTLLDEKRNKYPLQGARTLTPLRAIFSFTFLKKFFPNNIFYKKYWMLSKGKLCPTVEVDIVPGSAFMIRREIFENIGRFDEKFFLYFEENDLCKRVRDAGFKIALIAKSKVIHLWGKSTGRSNLDLKNIFLNSLRYYSKKHYGILWAFIIDKMMRITKETIILSAVFIIGFYLRFKNVQLNLGFDGEVGSNLLDLKNAYLYRQIPLHGAPTSHPWLYFPPLFYWIYGIILILSNFNPISHSYYGVIVSCFTLVAMYFFCKKAFDNTVAIIATALIASSPLFIFASVIGRFIYTVPLISLLFYWLLIQFASGKKGYVVWIFFTLGLLLNFHYTPIFFFPAIITVMYIKKIFPTLKQWIYASIAFIIPLFPLILFDSKNHFTMIKNFALWIPYRILGFIGLYHKNTVSEKVLAENISSFINFLSFNFSPSSRQSATVIGAIISVLLLIYMLFVSYKFFRFKTININVLVLLSCFFWGILATFVHGNPPLHYFVPLFPIPIILISVFFKEISEKSKILVILVIILIFSINALHFLSEKIPSNALTYQTRQRVSRYIVNNAKGKHFSLKRIGYNDFYKDNFAQNYIYLLWWYGNEPVQNAPITYIIVEDKNRTPPLQKGQLLKKIDNVEIIRVKKV